MIRCQGLTSTAQVGWHIASTGEAALAITTLILRVGPRAHQMYYAKEAGADPSLPLEAGLKRAMLSRASQRPPNGLRIFHRVAGLRHRWLLS